MQKFKGIFIIMLLIILMAAGCKNNKEDVDSMDTFT